jgi:type IV secretory pathway TrbD component
VDKLTLGKVPLTYCATIRFLLPGAPTRYAVWQSGVLAGALTMLPTAWTGARSGPGGAAGRGVYDYE